jgi:hypothetical protein
MKFNLSTNCDVEVYARVDLRREVVVICHHDGDSNDIEVTPDEADAIADAIKAAAKTAREAVRP